VAEARADSRETAREIVEETAEVGPEVFDRAAAETLDGDPAVPSWAAEVWAGAGAEVPAGTPPPGETEAVETGGAEIAASGAEAQPDPVPHAPAEAPSAEPSTPIAKITPIPLNLIRPGRFQARDYFDEDELRALTASIRDKGVLQPILVRHDRGEEESYSIVAGERRWRASSAAGLRTIPAIVMDISDMDAMEIALVENLQRHDLTPIEEAEGYARMIHVFGRTQEDVARSVGKSRSHVANTLRLLQLPESVKWMVSSGELSAGHARALIGAADPESLAHHVVTHDLTVRQTEQLVNSVLSGDAAPEAATMRDEDLIALERDLSWLLGLNVKINLHGEGERDTVTIYFKGLEHLGDVIARLQTEV